MIFDSHAHLTHISFDEDVRLVLKRAQDVGVEAIVNICTNPEEIAKGLKLRSEYPWVYLAAATTPHDVEKEGEAYFEQMEQCAQSGSLVAVGETGLDYHYFKETHAVQKHFLRKYLHLAKSCALPVVIHCREAFDDLFHIMDEEYQGEPGVLHCFTGTAAEAEEVIKRGLYLSLSGIVTFKKSIELQEVAKMVPLERLLIETDAPYLAPSPFRAKRNESSFLLETAKFIASLRNISLEELCAATSQNAHALFWI